MPIKRLRGEEKSEAGLLKGCIGKKKLWIGIQQVSTAFSFVNNIS